jgi:hypothetical protein
MLRVEVEVVRSAFPAAFE